MLLPFSISPSASLAVAGYLEPLLIVRMTIAGALEYLSRVTKRSSVTFIISDFYAKDFKMPLSIANKRHDIVALSITDPRELKLPDIGLLNLEDEEEGRSFMLDSSSSVVRRAYSENAANMFSERERLFRSINVDHIDIRTDIPYTPELYKFFRMRERRI